MHHRQAGICVCIQQVMRAAIARTKMHAGACRLMGPYMACMHACIHVHTLASELYPQWVTKLSPKQACTLTIISSSNCAQHAAHSHTSPTFFGGYICICFAHRPHVSSVQDTFWRPGMGTASNTISPLSPRADEAADSVAALSKPIC
jgi:hypothetical protein